MNQKSFVTFVSLEFSRITKRISYRRRAFAQPIDVSINFEEDGDFLYLVFSAPGNIQKVAIPKPYLDEHNNVIVGRDVKRAVGSWYLVDTTVVGTNKTWATGDKSKELGYWDLMKILLTESVEDYFPNVVGSTKKVFLESIIASFERRKAPLVVRAFQKIVSSIVNELPICGTPMQTWAMNNRVMFIDPIFDGLTPQEVLEYQCRKNQVFFPWTSVGLSDSSMVKNYMLKVDLRNYSPFCKKHHSPMRNLYQPLGMTGPEKPLIQTQSMNALASKGISRGGWNWMTAFIDLPLNFEDQIIVNAKHQDKINVTTQQYLSFGTLFVKEGDNLSYGEIISIEPGDRKLSFQSHAESATITEIKKRDIPINGTVQSVNVITVELKRSFKDGFKFTNLHGNKGIAVFCDTGTMFNPVGKNRVDIDVIVAAKTVGNRKNFGQIMEALATLVNGPNTNLTLDDNVLCDIGTIKKRFVKEGGREDCTSDIITQWGKFKAICGWVFWGLLKEPEDSLWEQEDVTKITQLGVRESGNKISHIEFKGLTTIFGPGNGVVREILSHQEGTDIVDEYMNVLKSMRGELAKDVPIIPWNEITTVDQSKGFLHTKDVFLGTVADERFHKDGFVIQLPFKFVTHIPYNKKMHQPFEEATLAPTRREGFRMFFTDKVYVPFLELREPWQHQCGLWGLSDITAFVNGIIEGCRKFAQDIEDIHDVEQALHGYFHSVSTKLSTKTGMISKHCLSVRYPHSVKATAAQASNLPANTVEIHRDMAKDLGIHDGDFVLVERFPCLGFLSLRVQRVRVTDDKNCKFVIRVSGPSLNSLALDFDGDVIYLMAFRTEEAKACLEYEFLFPNAITKKYIDVETNKKVPRIAEATIDDLAAQSLKNGQPPMTFADITPEVQGEIVRSLAGIKTGTGTSVALGYNITRIAEGEVSYEDTEVHAGIEVILDKVANSVFGSKHRVAKLLEKLS